MGGRLDDGGTGAAQVGAAQVGAAQAAPDQPGTLFRAVDAALAERPGHLLFTILLHHPERRERERLYSSMPDRYEVGGRKPVTDSAWTRRVLWDGQPYIGRNREDIRAVFADHALIESLGCRSVLNVPVRWAGHVVGTLNLLHREGFYREADVAAVSLVGQLALPGLLDSARQSFGG